MTSFMFATKWKHNLKSLVATRWQQLQQCRRDGLEFYLYDCYDRLNTCRDGYFLMKQKNHSVATILLQWGGGAQHPLMGDRVCLFKTADR
jgi:hypothetical protein